MFEKERKYGTEMRECKHHGFTTFAIKKTSSTCLKCSNISNKKSSEKNKERSNSLNIPRHAIKYCDKHGKNTEHRLRADRGFYICMECRVEGTKLGRLRAKKISVDKLGGKCIVCGYNKCLSALEFHHVDPKNKEYNGNEGLMNMNKKFVEKELDKCVLVCANCHREIHAGLHPHLIEAG
jgi:hypothetical protein